MAVGKTLMRLQVFLNAPSMAKKVLITGAAGFVGSRVADELLESGCAVCVLDNLAPQVHGMGLGDPDWLR